MKQFLVCVLAFVGICVFAMTGIAQAEPVLISEASGCITTGDRATISYYRALCDEVAEDKLGYKNGFLRPMNPTDGTIIKCAAEGTLGLLPPATDPGITVYLCFGVPWEEKIY